VFVPLLDLPGEFLNPLKFLQCAFNVRIPTVRLREYFRFCLDLFCIAAAIWVKDFIRSFERGERLLSRGFVYRFRQDLIKRDIEFFLRFGIGSCVREDLLRRIRNCNRDSLINDLWQKAINAKTFTEGLATFEINVYPNPALIRVFASLPTTLKLAQHYFGIFSSAGSLYAFVR
jgi:hypothetical protein